jgi:glutathione peroxidase-family protein
VHCYYCLFLQRLSYFKLLLHRSEPGTDAEVLEFCNAKGVRDAHVFTKGDVNGASTRSTYRFLRENAGLGEVKWNFLGRFVVDQSGKVTLPESDEQALQLVKSLV